MSPIGTPRDPLRPPRRRLEREADALLGRRVSSGRFGAAEAARTARFLGSYGLSVKVDLETWTGEVGEIRVEHGRRGRLEPAHPPSDRVDQDRRAGDVRPSPSKRGRALPARAPGRVPRHVPRRRAGRGSDLATAGPVGRRDRETGHGRASSGERTLAQATAGHLHARGCCGIGHGRRSTRECRLRVGLDVPRSAA
jgi:hypothetical protein